MSDYQQNQNNGGNNNWRQNNGGGNNQGGGNGGWQGKKQWGGANGGGGGGFQKKPWSGGGGVNFRKILMESKLRLTGEKAPDVQYKNDFPPQLLTYMEETNPRWVIRSNMEDGPFEIIARMDPILMQIAMDMIVMAANGEKGFRQSMVLKNRDLETKQIYDETRLTIGKHQDNGVVYIEVSPLDKDTHLKFVFNFTSRAFSEMLHGDGAKMEAGFISPIVAKAWAKRVNDLYTMVMATLPPKKKQWNGNQGGNNQNGGYQKKPWQGNNNGGGNNRGGQGGGNSYGNNNNRNNNGGAPAAPAEPRQQYGNSSGGGNGGGNGYVQRNNDSSDYQSNDDIPY